MKDEIEKEPFVSVLTPVYNGEEFLRECIESVLNQNYDNWEYVLVNNRSSDRTLQIIEEYAAQESRIRIHNNKEHLPQMKNLNHAFRQISPESKYCKVVHADDMLFKNCLGEMVSLAEEYPTVGIVSSYRIDDCQVNLAGLPYPSHFNNGREIARDFLLGDSYYFGAPTTLLIRSSLIRKRDKVYDETYLQSDISACLDILKESDFGFVHQVLSFTRRHEDTVTSNVAKKYATHMLGNLKIHLEYAAEFLSEKKSEQVIKWQIEKFYIDFARNLFLKERWKTYERHAEELNSIGYKVKIGKLIKYLLRETILQLFFKMGIELQKVRNNSGTSEKKRNSKPLQKKRYSRKIEKVKTVN